MRSFTKFPSSSSSSSNFISFTSSYSTSSSGRGRGRGLISPNFNFTKEDDSHHPSSPSSSSSNSENKSSPLVFGHGHRGGGGGRGKPFPSTQVLPPPSSSSSSSSSSFVANPASGRGRGLGLGIGSTGPISHQPTPLPAPPSDPNRKTPGTYDSQAASIPGRPLNREETHLPSSIISVISGGAGRGKVPNLSPPSLGRSDKSKEENRHIRARQPQGGRDDETIPKPQQRLSQEEAVKKAVGILSRGGEGVAASRVGRGGGGPRGGRGRGLQGRRGGQGGGRGRGRGERGGRSSEDAVDDDDYGTGLYLGDNADGEKLALRLGADVMNQLVEAFEDMSSRVLPSPVDDAYEDALRTNLMIECEPEYLMGDFSSNPDVDEKPPMSLRDALEKVKPFLMAYENIQTQQEWEEAIEETMKNVPVLKEIVDIYSGPDRVTAKQQQEELERVAKTLPESAPASVKRFTNNAVLSLQSNPGWGLDKKCQLMDKLVQEVFRQCK